ncbi:MAG TPA: rod shape-determining protein MreD [Solirubrobacterales bacterium]|nr:rod shape-determining protein MreD [Solirubrobacterales bacterium]
MILTPNILVRITGLALIAVLLQVTFFSRISLLGAAPDFAVLIVIVLGLLGGVTVGAVCGFAIGLLIDCLIAAPLGGTGLAFILVGYLAGLYRERSTRAAGRLAVPLLCLLLTLTAALALLAVQFMLGLSGPFSAGVAFDLILQALYASLLSIPIYAGTRRLLRPALIDETSQRSRPRPAVLET